LDGVAVTVRWGVFWSRRLSMPDTAAWSRPGAGSGKNAQRAMQTR
jgi:hypothetical protein